MDNKYQPESVVSPIVFNPLSVDNLTVMRNNTKFFDIIRPILLVSSINVLNIQCIEIFIDTLIEFIRLLPNLNILVINSSAMMEPKCLSKEEETALDYVSKNNKITKVVLQQITELEQLQFFSQLCPHMRHLEVFCSNEVDPGTLLRFIFKNKFTHIANLISVGIRMSKPNEETKEKLQKLIILEEFRQDFTIKKRDNRICLRRNKV
jgi:hypothetical protein